MDFFKKSTHAKGILTTAQIEEIRLKIHEESAKRMSDGISWLTLEEAELIKRFYQAKISDVCAFLKLPKFIQPVAHWLYMRYHLAESLLRFDSKHVMYSHHLYFADSHLVNRLTCILLATKIENLHLSAADFTNKIPNCQPSLITEIELVLLEALHFNLLFFHPHSALQGFALALEADNEKVKDATKVLDLLVTTDALLIESPSHLALASFNVVIPERADAFIDANLSDILDKDELKQRLTVLSSYSRPSTPFDTNLLKEIDRKLHSARSSLK